MSFLTLQQRCAPCSTSAARHVRLGLITNRRRHQRHLSVRRAASDSSQAQFTASVPSVSELKEQLYSLVGNQNGLDRTAEQRGQIGSLLSQIESLNPSPSPATVDLTGTEWTLVYTSSTGNSSGKLGPFVGRTGQQFPAATPGRYVNSSDYGPNGVALQTRLMGEFKASGDRRIDLVFQDVTFKALGGLLTYTRPFPGGFRGHWVMRYVDEDLRVLDTNQGNVFVMRRDKPCE